MLNPGDQAPDFELPNADMRMVRMADFIGSKNIILYFYPKDDTTGCTIEALEFTDRLDEFEAAETVVLGISRDNCVSHAEFRDKHGISVNLLADPDGEVCFAYDVWREREVHGEKRQGILRSTFLIDRRGVVRHALYDVKPKGHAAQLLELAQAL